MNAQRIPVNLASCLRESQAWEILELSQWENAKASNPLTNRQGLKQVQRLLSALLCHLATPWYPSQSVSTCGRGKFLYSSATAPNYSWAKSSYNQLGRSGKWNWELVSGLATRKQLLWTSSRISPFSEHCDPHSHPALAPPAFLHSLVASCSFAGICYRTSHFVSVCSAQHLDSWSSLAFLFLPSLCFCLHALHKAVSVLIKPGISTESSFFANFYHLLP